MFLNLLTIFDEENHFDYDETNLSDSFNSTQDNQVYITTHEEEEFSDDETISIEDDSYEERHRGICESCHHIGIVGTTCENCKPNEWASTVKITPGWQIYLNKRHHEESLSPEALMRMMETHGIGICSNCNRIGTKGFYCRNCVKMPGMINRLMYTDHKEVL
jgi:hypothetical protein